MSKKIIAMLPIAEPGHLLLQAVPGNAFYSVHNLDPLYAAQLAEAINKVTGELMEEEQRHAGPNP